MVSICVSETLVCLRSIYGRATRKYTLCLEEFFNVADIWGIKVKLLPVICSDWAVAVCYIVKSLNIKTLRDIGPRKQEVQKKCLFLKFVVTIWSTVLISREIWGSHYVEYDMTPCSLVKRYQRFGGTCCLHLQVQTVLILYCFRIWHSVILVIIIWSNVPRPFLSLKNGNITFWYVTPYSLVDTCVSEERVASTLRPDKLLDYDFLMYDAVKFGRYVPT